MMEVLISSETSDLTRATPRNIPEEGILYLKYRFSCRFDESLSSYNEISNSVLLLELVKRTTKKQEEKRTGNK
jgi:hypothetical protein